MDWNGFFVVLVTTLIVWKLTTVFFPTFMREKSRKTMWLKKIGCFLIIFVIAWSMQESMERAEQIPMLETKHCKSLCKDIDAEYWKYEHVHTGFGAWAEQCWCVKDGDPINVGW